MDSLADIGVNLCCRQFRGKVKEILDNADKSGVKFVISISNSLKECSENVKKCKLFDNDGSNVCCTVGVHPHNAKNLHKGNFNVLERIIVNNRKHVVAIGECGLDYDRMFSSVKQQKMWFEEQIKLALRLNFPLYFHERAAHSDFCQIVEKYDLAGKGVVHCFTGTKIALLKYLELGFYIGITGWICDDKRGKELQNIVKLIPLNRILIETDAPWLTPKNPRIEPRPKYNEPKYLPIVLKKTAGCMKVKPEVLAKFANENRKRLFGR
jgi:TatD DNase family protein